MEIIKLYFNSEKYESILFVLIGTAVMAFAGYLLIIEKGSFYRGMLVPLVTVALVQIVVGSTVWHRSPKDIERVQKIVKEEPTRIRTEEIPRMIVVLKNFKIYRYVEIFLIAFGIICMFGFGTHQFMKGLGFGLFIQASIMLSLDFFAERRAEHYFGFLNELL